MDVPNITKDLLTDMSEWCRVGVSSITKDLLTDKSGRCRVGVPVAVQLVLHVRIVGDGCESRVGPGVSGQLLLLAGVAVPCRDEVVDAVVAVLTVRAAVTEHQAGDVAWGIG